MAGSDEWLKKFLWDEGSPKGEGFRTSPPWLRWGFVVVAAAWTSLIMVLWAVDSYKVYQSSLSNAETAARHSYSKDINLRRWVTEHGGIYVPVTEQTPPSPYLSNLPERDLVTPSGRLLTLINPSYAVRKINAKADPELGVLSKLTSLQPVRPENAPDAWEAEALRRLIANPDQKEFVELAEVDNQPFLRMMRILEPEPSCMQCHYTTDANVGAEGNVGSLRGGISTLVPWQPYREAMLGVLANHGLAYGVLWLIGLLLTGGAMYIFQLNFARLQQGENTLRRSEEKYRRLAEGIEAIPWEFDLAVNRWSYIAPQVEKILGYKQAEWTDFSFWVDRIHPEDREAAENYCRHYSAMGEDHVFDYRFQKKGGDFAWLRDVVSVEKADGRPVYLRGVMIDLTGSRLLEEKLRQSAKMEAVGTLAAGVAHDFNNILTSLISFATLVKRRHRDDEVSQDYLQEILDSARRAAELTRSLLAYSRKQQIELKPEDLGKTVEKNQKMLRRIIRENIELKLELIDRPLPVMADHVQIEQVLMNLASNAQDAMPAGGRLTIGAGWQEKAPSELELVTAGPWAVLTMADTGFGIDPEIRKRIFDPFFTTKEVGRGTGLGLSMVQGVVQQHGGAIRLESEPGQGSTFTIYLPLISEQSNGPKEPEPSTFSHEKSQGATILLVEDEEQVRRVLQRVLEQQGHQVLLAVDGQEALTFFSQNPSDINLVIMDVVMPKLNGRETGLAMRRIKPDLPIILISGYTNDVVNSEDLAAEGFHFIHKPIEPAVLINQVREVLADCPSCSEYCGK
ncbi:ATP-binding response regulator [Desulfurivibrio alkaliphilus]|uniref:histidine kinase n=1 Tax=Desulfurivibrio alkaliphilus (strain DSM 19089 / UNIQEM U267 / AHT2) TaxID=589865 RepID=D6Z1A2_DESAT|nr:ATP-binding protein [Desulfurivibrio alkaliphilus]ADH85357.1 multi-sensor hybrid histidine kinase [Desulfurivibrio alkaliphilus AHT 2]